MVMVIHKKIIRSMMESKSLYIGSLALIIVSCLLFTMYNQMLINVNGTVSSFEKDYVQEDASFVASEKLSNMEQIENNLQIVIEEGGSFDADLSDDQTLRVFAQTSKVNRYAVVEGEGLSGGDMLLDPAFAHANEIEIGDSVTVGEKTFAVSGFMSLPNYIYPLKAETDLITDANSFGIAVIGRNDYNEFNKGTVFYSVKAAGDGTGTKEKLEKLKRHLESENIAVLKWTDIADNPRVSVMDAKLDSAAKMSSILPVFILLLTCILTGIVMWRMLQSEFVIIGSLYALGYKKGEIRRHYLMYPLTVALAGGVAGTILGALTVKPILAFYLSFFNLPLGSIHYDFTWFVISVLLPVVFLSVCGFFVVNRALKHTPVELMRGGAEKSKVGFIERHLHMNGLKFATKFKLREQLRSIPRSVFLLVGVIFATMLLLMGFTMKSSVDYLMKDSIEGAYKYKYQYFFNKLQSGTPAEGEAFSESLVSPASDSDIHFAIYGVNPDSRYVVLKDSEGNPLAVDHVIVTKPLAEKLNIQAGDTVQVAGKANSKKFDVTVDSVADTFVGTNIYMPIAMFNELHGYSAGSYMGLWTDKKLDLPEESLLNVTTVDDIKKAFDSMLAPMQAMIGAIAAVSFIIGLLVIYVVTSLIIAENKNNISLMKVLGYRKKEVYSLILNSSSYIVILGFIIGVPVILASLDAMYKSVTKTMTFALPVRIDYIYVIIGFVIIYLTFEVSKALSRKKVNRISMTEALKSRAE